MKAGQASRSLGFQLAFFFPILLKPFFTVTRSRVNYFRETILIVQIMEEDRNALEHIINEIVTKSNTELKQQRQKLAIDALRKNNNTSEAHSIPLKPSTAEGDAAFGLMSNANPRISPHIISDTLAAFVLRSVAMSPEHNFNVDMEFTADEVKQIINF
jgi:hypothetical protein